MKNKGLLLIKEAQDTSAEDWQFGAFSKPCLASVPEQDRENYLPQGELQFGKEDFMSCATLAPINVLASKFTYGIKNKLFSPENIKWLFDKGYTDEQGRCDFSDRFNAILSGTSRQGNSLIAPIKSIHSDGLVPKPMLPANGSMTWDEYHDPEAITPEMIGLGAEFIQRFQINYERVLEIHYPELLKDDCFVVAGYAWSIPVDGEYPRTDNYPNHAFMLYKNPAYYIFDNYYDEGREGDFIKKLAKDYDLMDYGYRVYISSEGQPKKINPIKDTIHKLWDFFPVVFPCYN